ncbi:hypothetical protein GGX14DRAFT_674038 [Mycena pura]|uniref:Uncharacterized protein n=1 Tax=Mycena pura TaxID=153505 RepID=A0AAD6Y4G6_9AGAR|nr:hypothetical protein GGX14DRAFT_674038 [Mycena pura]
MSSACDPAHTYIFAPYAVLGETPSANDAIRSENKRRLQSFLTQYASEGSRINYRTPLPILLHTIGEGFKRGEHYAPYDAIRGETPENKLRLESFFKRYDVPFREPSRSGREAISWSESIEICEEGMARIQGILILTNCVRLIESDHRYGRISPRQIVEYLQSAENLVASWNMLRGLLQTKRTLSMRARIETLLDDMTQESDLQSHLDAIDELTELHVELCDRSRKRQNTRKTRRKLNDLVKAQLAKVNKLIESFGRVYEDYTAGGRKEITCFLEERVRADPQRSVVDKRLPAFRHHARRPYLARTALLVVADDLGDFGLKNNNKITRKLLCKVVYIWDFFALSATVHRPAHRVRQPASASSTAMGYHLGHQHRAVRVVVRISNAHAAALPRDIPGRLRSGSVDSGQMQSRCPRLPPIWVIPPGRERVLGVADDIGLLGLACQAPLCTVLSPASAIGTAMARRHCTTFDAITDTSPSEMRADTFRSFPLIRAHLARSSSSPTTSKTMKHLLHVVLYILDGFGICSRAPLFAVLRACQLAKSQITSAETTARPSKVAVAGHLLSLRDEIIPTLCTIVLPSAYPVPPLHTPTCLHRKQLAKMLPFNAYWHGFERGSDVFGSNGTRLITAAPKQNLQENIALAVGEEKKHAKKACPAPHIVLDLASATSGDQRALYCIQ